MGANAQTAVPAFTAGQVLTAAQQTQINTGIPVFADTTARDAAFGNTGKKTLAEGQFAYIEATNTTQYYDGSAWQPVGASGLTLVKSQTIGTAVSSVSVTGAFNSTYDNYKIVIGGGTGSTPLHLKMTLGASTTQYYFAGLSNSYSGGGTGSNTGDNLSAWEYVGYSNSAVGATVAIIELVNPNLALNTYGTALVYRSGNNLGHTPLFHNVATAYTDFTISTNTGTLTGGTIRVYGYANS